MATQNHARLAFDFMILLHVLAVSDFAVCKFGIYSFASFLFPKYKEFNWIYDETVWFGLVEIVMIKPTSKERIVQGFLHK